MAPQARNIPACDSFLHLELRPADYRYRLVPTAPAQLLCRQCTMGRVAVHLAMSQPQPGPFVEPLR